MNDACRRYAEDPEGNAAHLRDCLACREIYALLDRPVDAKNIDVAVPFAPWEGAGYRSWPLVIGAALALTAIAFALCAAAGISPASAIATGMSASQWRVYIIAAAEALRSASPIWQVAFGFGFLVVNTVLVLLLRRAPRGIDA
jgi:hypothetical protein